MEMIITAAQAKEIDRYSINQIGIPGIVLMERAALAASMELIKRTEEGARILILAGMGNNGADGLAMARILLQNRRNITVLMIGNPEKASAENKLQQNILSEMGVLLQYSDLKEAMPSLPFADYYVDALFGVGLSRPLNAPYQELIRQIKGNQALGTKVLAIDIPSGICADNGQILGAAVKADVTVTFGYRKLGMVLVPGKAYAGEVITADIGFVLPHGMKKQTVGAIDNKEDLKLPGRDPFGNKGTFGKVLVIAGSVGMCGASYLVARSAYRSGAGLVKIFTVKDNLPMLQMLIPEAILETYDPECFYAEALRKSMDWADAVICGPGLSTRDYAGKLLDEVLTSCKKPLVLDADALNLISEKEERKALFTDQMILTPHLGEMSRLTKTPIGDIKTNLVGTAKAFAASYKCTLILKDAVSVIAHGNDLWLNLSGTDGMATGGSGDCLTGIIGAFLAAGMKPAAAARAGAYIHGKSGEAAEADYGKHGMTSKDLAEKIGMVLKEYE